MPLTGATTPDPEDLMGTRDRRVDTYIARSAEYSRPILSHLREVVHSACPEVEETMKWNFPHFMYEGMLCGMASFKQHCAFGFWKGSLIVDGKGAGAKEAMGQLGRITKLSDLPSKATLARYVRRAMRLNEQGIPSPSRAARKPRPPLPVPADLAAALKKKKKALAAFEGFSPSHRREYIEWITEARGEATRQRRIETAIEWMSEGKSRHWKYAKC
jgi:uncharacterized protein YdeI (YjbR/CyaY-like superfamily)